MAVQIQVRRDVAADWTAADPVLAEGEIGFETDTNKFKIGDGASVWSALGYFSGGGGGVGDVSDIQFARKSSDTSRSSTTTPTDDPDLAVVVGANEIWEFRIQIKAISSSTAPDIKLTMAAPAGASGWWAWSNSVGNAGGTHLTVVTTQDFGVTKDFGVIATSRLVAEISGLMVNGATSGSLALQWSQNTSDGVNPTTVEANSYMIAHRVA